MDPKVNSLALFIRSNDGDGTRSDFKIAFDNLAAKYNRVALLSANIPKTYYACDGDLIVTIESVEYTVSAIGNYNYRTFATYLTTTLSNLTSVDFTVSRNDLLLTYTITVTGNVEPVRIQSTSLKRQLGFSDETFASSFVTGISKFVIDTLLIRSDITSSTLRNQNGVIASIPDINTQYGSSIHYEVNDVVFASRPYNGKDQIRFYVTDSDNEIVTLNSDWNFELVFYKSLN